MDDEPGTSNETSNELHASEERLPHKGMGLLHTCVFVRSRASVLVN